MLRSIVAGDDETPNSPPARRIGDLLAASLTARRITAILAIAPFMAIAILLLARPAPTLAHGSRTACSMSVTHPAKSGAPACARSARNKIRARLKAKVRHAKHAVAKKRAHAKTKAPRAAATAPAEAPVPTTPRCEAGTD